MNSKIKNHVEILFIEIPKTIKSVELKEEILSNMNERFEDYLSNGKDEQEAYKLTINSFGNMDEILEEVMPDDNFLNNVEFYRERNAKLTAIAIAIYILSPIPLFSMSIFESMEIMDILAIIGLNIFLVLVAIATAVIIYCDKSTPLEYSSYLKQTKNSSLYDVEHENLLKDRKFQEINKVYWLLILSLYLIISFVTGLWGTTWIIWIIGTFGIALIKFLFLQKTN